MKKLSTAQAMRYNRHVLLSGFDLDKQEILVNSKVLVIGIGGLGCAVSQYLTASGVGHLTLIDDDVVESTNLQRQVLHEEQTIGLLKVESAAVALKRLNAGVELTLLSQRQSEKELSTLIEGHDLVLDCTDNFTTRNLINKVSYQHSKPLVSGAAIRMEGQVFCIDPTRKSACYACISHNFGEQDLSCVESGVMSPVVGIIGSTQALEAIKMLTDYGEPPINQLQLFDAMRSDWQAFNVSARPNCPVCGQFD
jgi:adenylyltransferase/sulfurtransferase